jgi:heme oxygenase
MKPEILIRLKEETRQYHSQLEGNPLSQLVLSDRVGQADYTEWLSRFAGFYIPIEKLLSAVNWAETGFDFQERVKVPNLISDLLFLGLSGDDISGLPICQRMPEIASPEQAVGVLYVLEGATLGAQIIQRHLQTALGLTPSQGLSFFCSYGDAVGPMWQAYMQFAALAADTPEKQDAIVTAAVETFVCFEQWLSMERAALPA